MSLQIEWLEMQLQLMYQEAQSVQGELDKPKEFLADKAIMHNSLNECLKYIQHVGEDKEASQNNNK